MCLLTASSWNSQDNCVKTKPLVSHQEKFATLPARTPYEFGAKVGIATTNREGLVLAAKAFEGNPYDGHTLTATIRQAEKVCGTKAERVYVDRGYRGHDYEGNAKVMISGQRRGLTAQMKRELKRRSAIEASIGHMKTDGRLDRNFLSGKHGDASNALLAAAGHNLRLILNALIILLLWITKPIHKVVKTNICALLRPLATSTLDVVQCELKSAYATIKGFEVMRALRKGQAGIFNFTNDILGEARIVERAFGIGPCALAEAMTMLENHLQDAEA